jgi:hypothetical protein
VEVLVFQSHGFDLRQRQQSRKQRKAAAEGRQVLDRAALKAQREAFEARRIELEQRRQAEAHQRELELIFVQALGGWLYAAGQWEKAWADMSRAERRTVRRQKCQQKRRR